MTDGWVAQQLARYTYRPDWIMTLERDDCTFGARWRIRIGYMAPDSRDPSRQIPISARFAVPDYFEEVRDEDAFARWLQQTILDVERHESREWLRRDGLIYDDPHL